jgi:hypothetical protein
VSFLEYNDVLPKRQHKWFKEIVEGKDFSWCFNQDSAFNDASSEKRNPSFSRNICESETKFQDTYLSNKFELIFLTLLDTANLDINRLQRVRLGLYLPIKTEEKYNNIHIDRPTKHTVLLYYVNDNDGDTYWFDKDDNIIHRFTPKANTAVVFDGMIRHASSNPSTGFKISLNLNIDNSRI